MRAMTSDSGRDAQPCSDMFRSTTSIVFASSAVGWNSTTSVPAKSSGVWAGGM